MSNLGKVYLEAVKWIMRYLKESLNVGLSFGKSSNQMNVVSRFVDANYAKYMDKRRSRTAYVYTVFGKTIRWKTTLQLVVTLSTIEKST